MEPSAVPINAVRSCTTCHKAKARCVRRVGQESCERCARLKKDCRAKEPVLKRRRPTKVTRAAQLEKLENRIEHLVNALSSQQTHLARSDRSQPSPSVSQAETDQTAARLESCKELLETLNCDAINDDCYEEDSGLDATPGRCAPGKTGYTGKRFTAVTLSEAENLLSRYLRVMAPEMPFVILDSSSTAKELYNTKPVLLRAITTVALFSDLPRQQLLMRELIRDVSERIMLKGEKSTDLLQAIVVMLAWPQFHMSLTRQINNLLHLAMAVAGDMGLGRPHNKAVFYTFKHVQTIDDQRVLLAIWYYGSVISSTFQRLEGWPFTRHLQACLRSLEVEQAHKSDHNLVQLVKVQQVVESIQSTDLSGVPAKAYSRAFQADISKICPTDPSNEDDLQLRMQLLIADIFVWELSLNELIEDKNVAPSTVMEDLYKCVAAVNTFFEALFSIPTSTFLVVPFSLLGHFGHGFLVLTRLVTLEIEGWDLKALRERLDYLTIVEKLARKFDEVPRAAPDGIAVNNSAFGKWAQRLYYVRSIYASRYVESASGSAPTTIKTAKQARRQDELGHPTPPDDILNSEFFTHLDANFWSNVDFGMEMGFGLAADQPATVT